MRESCKRCLVFRKVFIKPNPLISDNVAQAEQALDQAISQDFKIRNNPVFMLLKGEVEFKAGHWPESAATLESLMTVKGVRLGSKDAVQDVGMFRFGDNLRCKAHLYLARALTKTSRMQEAKELIEQAIDEWTGTAEEVNVLMANSEIMVSTGDIKKAIHVLRTVERSSVMFAQSRKLMAGIYLTHLKDRRSFARCYLELIEVSSNERPLRFTRTTSCSAKPS